MKDSRKAYINKRHAIHSLPESHHIIPFSIYQGEQRITSSQYANFSQSSCTDCDDAVFECLAEWDLKKVFFYVPYERFFFNDLQMETLSDKLTACFCWEASKKINVLWTVLLLLTIADEAQQD